MKIKTDLTVFLCLLAVLFLFGFLAQAEEKTTTTTQSTTTTTVPSQPDVKKSNPSSVTNVNTQKKETTTTTVNATSTTLESPRTVYDQDTLKKMSDSLCSEGFKAYVGSETKNVCQGMAKSPDIAYSCVWDETGPAAYPATNSGPCALDFTEHRGKFPITREYYKSGPPLSYGTEVQCCFRSAKGSGSPMPVVNK